MTSSSPYDRRFYIKDHRDSTQRLLDSAKEFHRSGEVAYWAHMKYLAEFLFDQGNWTAVISLADDVLQDDRAVLADLFGKNLMESSQREKVLALSGLHDLRAFSQLMLGHHPDEVLPGIEEGRARLLAHALRADERDHGSESLDISKILALIPADGAVVLPLITEAGSKVFVLRGGSQSVSSDDVLDLPELKETSIRVWLYGPLRDEEIGGYLGAYNDFRAGLDPRPASGEAWEWLYTAWNSAITTILERLWDELLGHVHDHLVSRLQLPKGAPVALMPTGLLGILPLACAGPDGSKRSWAEHWSLSLIPNLHTLQNCQKRVESWRREGSPIRLFGVLDPEPSGKTPLKGARSEQFVLQHHFAGCGNDDILIGRRAELGRIRKRLEQAIDLFHFSGHSYHNFGCPEDSAIVLAGLQPLALKALLNQEIQSTGIRLIWLCTCDSGLHGIRRAVDEFIGLPVGWLMAGGAAVLASLWPVRDDATLLLVDRFYQEWQPDENGVRPSPAQALAKAQAWLRQVTIGELRKRYVEVIDDDGMSAIDLGQPLYQTQLPALITAQVLELAPAYRITEGGSDRQKHELVTSNDRIVEDDGTFAHGPYLPLGDDSLQPYSQPAFWAAFTITGV